MNTVPRRPGPGQESSADSTDTRPVEFGDPDPGPRPAVAKARSYLVEGEPGFDPARDPWPSGPHALCPACDGSDGRCRTDVRAEWVDCWHGLGSRFDAPVRVAIKPHRRGRRPAEPRVPAFVADLRAELRAAVDEFRAEFQSDVSVLAGELLAVRGAVGIGGAS